MFWGGSEVEICWGNGNCGWFFCQRFTGGGIYIMTSRYLSLWISRDRNFIWSNLVFEKFREQSWWGSFFSVNRYVGCKVTFKRKGSWLHFRRVWPRFISLKFGYGHPTRVFMADGFYCRRKKYLQRHSLVINSGLWVPVLNCAKSVRNWRYFGRYTKRGVRLARELFYYQQGKESQYTKLKSKIF